jgi:hypothetical protein
LTAVTPSVESPDIRAESGRIDFLLRRDGLEATRKWVERTIGLYKAELARRGYCSDPIYRARFETAVQQFEYWLYSVRA